MPYCEAIIMEILRLADITPEGLPHYSRSPIKLGQYIIPAGHMLMPSLTNIMKGDQESWSRPEDFNPERLVAAYLHGTHHIIRGFYDGDGTCHGGNPRMT